MRKSDSTLRDVAAKVGVSTRTVSRVVNGEGGFSAGTEARVRAAIEELGYRPNLLARSLITKRSGTVGLVGGSMLDPFFPELAEGVQQAGEERGLTIFFASTNDEPSRQQRAIDSMLSRAVDGMVIFPVRGRLEPLLDLVDTGVTVVAINPPEPHPTISTIRADIEGGVALAVEHLQALGRRRIVFLANDAPSSTQRERGFRRAIGQGEARVHPMAPTAGAAMAGVDEVLRRWPDVDAIFTYNDVMAIGAIRALSLAGRRVPDDVAVVGFDNIGLSAFVNPPLTTIDLGQLTIGRTAIELLDAEIGDPDLAPCDTVQPVELVIRESSGSTGRS